MFNMPISLLAMNRTPAAVRQFQAPAENTAVPKTVTTQTVRNWEDSRRLNVIQYEGAFNLEMRNPSTHYIPQHLNEDGSWSLTQYIPFSIDGPLPDGAVSLPPTCGQDMLDRIGQLAGQLHRGFDARA